MGQALVIVGTRLVGEHPFGELDGEVDGVLTQAGTSAGDLVANGPLCGFRDATGFVAGALDDQVRLRASLRFRDAMKAGDLRFKVRQPGNGFARSGVGGVTRGAAIDEFLTNSECTCPRPIADGAWNSKVQKDEREETEVDGVLRDALRRRAPAAWVVEPVRHTVTVVVGRVHHVVRSGRGVWSCVRIRGLRCIRECDGNREKS